MGRNSKRSKAYYHNYLNNAKRRKTNELESNMIGFLCTCAGHRNEKACVKEAYNLLNEFGDIIFGKEQVSPVEDASSIDESKHTEDTKQKEISDDSDEDVDSCLQSEIAATKSDQSLRRFQQKRCPVNNCIFISTTVSDPVKLNLAIMDSILAKKEVCTKNLLRMVPVQNTCKSYTADIERVSKEIIFAHFPKTKIRYYVAVRIRNNSAIKREDLGKLLSNVICEFNLEAIADYKEPEIVLNVDVLKNICCIGLCPEYLTKYCKYNLIQLAQPEIETNEICSITKELTPTNKNDNSDEEEVAPATLVIEDSDKGKSEKHIGELDKVFEEDKIDKA